MFYSIDVQTIIQNPKINQVQSEFEIKIIGQNRVYGNFAKYCGFENTYLKNTLFNKLECIIFIRTLIDLLLK